MDSVFNGIGKNSVKANNMSAILNCIYMKAPISRRDIAKMTGLTPSTVTTLVNEMMDYGVLREGGMIDEGPRTGRRALNLEFNASFGYILGVCIEQAKISLALTPIVGNDLTDVHVYGKKSVENTYQGDELVPELLNMLDQFLEEYAPKGRFCAIGVSVTGHADPKKGISTNSFGVLPSGTRLKEIFEERYGVVTFVYNNVHSLALADMGMRRDESPINGLFLKQDPGLGCTLMINGQIHEGVNNFAGEIGHTRVLKNGKRCSCGRTGCLTTVVGTKYLLEAAGIALSPSSTPALWALSKGKIEDLTIKMLLASAERNDKPIQIIVDEALRLLANVIETCLLLLDGDTVILFGPLFESEWVIKNLRDDIDKEFGDFREIRIMRSMISDSDRWKGAVHIALQNYIPVIGQEISDRENIRQSPFDERWP